MMKDVLELSMTSQKNKICVVMWFDGLTAKKYGKLSYTINKAYCDKYGYDFGRKAYGKPKQPWGESQRTRGSNREKEMGRFYFPPFLL